MRSDSPFSLPIAAFALLVMAPAAPWRESRPRTPRHSRRSNSSGCRQGVVGWEVGAFTQIPSTYRLQMQPGTALPVSNGPELSLVFVESGEVVLTPQGELAINHREAGKSPEVIPAGQGDHTARAGDYFVGGGSAPTEIRNDSDAVASLQFAMMDPQHPIIVDPNQTPGLERHSRWLRRFRTGESWEDSFGGATPASPAAPQAGDISSDSWQRVAMTSSRGRARSATRARARNVRANEPISSSERHV